MRHIGLYDAIRLNALKAVIDQTDSDYQYRYIMRWYSKTFHTPLHEVECLPIEDVLRHYFETTYEGFEYPKLKEEVYELTTTDQEKAAAVQKEDEALKGLIEETKKATEKIVSSKPDLTMNQVAQLQQLSKLSPIDQDVKLPSPSLEPDIHVRFLDDDEELPEIDDSNGGFVALLTKPPPK